MVDSDLLHKELRQALISGNIDDVINTISENEDVEIDYQDVTHDLQTLLMHLCYVDIDTSSLLAFLEAIFNKGPDVNIQDRLGRTVLMHACIANLPMFIEGLLEYGDTDVTILDSDGNSALTYAVQNCDVYVVEDILHHEGGITLLSHQNRQGHTPITLARKCNRKDILKVLETYDDQVPKNDGTSRSRRKPRNRQVATARELPPAYSPSPERRKGYSSARDIVQTRTNYSNSSYEKEGNGFNNEYESAIPDKCDSAPVTRSERALKANAVTSLSLSSPRLNRRHHKQDCLLTETLLNNQNKKFPGLQDTKCNSHDTLEPPEYSLNNRKRRPSLSLPDLRNVTGNLVNSGNSTPETGESSSPTNDDQYEDYDTNDDVFSQSYPNAHQKEVRQKVVPPYLRQQSDNQLSLPNINKGLVSLTGSKSKSKGLTPLGRQRKFSNSDDHLQRNSGNRD
ncbi:uncharacterized protein LOC128222223 isoform X2 [Mya arenaria]|nr:uncharacterized protein LOC128222223 isoform X2 [Mya arenaria]XP_052787116.1 uncharacterized protein LOC128222223 isoform X2 [Mya arenaria]XP_052787118.1 uncharacterized protein LOC128222223 isoform X2 [Mya arenaria]XP_052787119.1 uncharacterized protein LOC128222223 isoform X2 [Mya arenaria]XP_052787120.1 uncharacterized protein LOC128222223 isoform X2 [Mya arenaria]